MNDRQRHLKCDEEKPVCNRCKRAGRTCEYRGSRDGKRRYAPIVAKAEPESNSSPVSTAASSYGTSPSYSASWSLSPSVSSRRGSAEDYQYLHHFRTYTAYQLEGPFTKDVWHSLVLQLAENDESLWQGVIAISALSKTSAYPMVHADSKGPDAARHYEYGLQVYGRALAAMQHLAESPQMDRRALLVSCLLIICFETLHGNRTTALRQVQVGLRLLAESIPVRATTHQQSSRDLDMDNLVAAFEELRVQTWLMESGLVRRTEVDPGPVKLSLPPTLPNVFVDLAQARDAAMVILKNTQVFMANLVALGYHSPVHQISNSVRHGGRLTEYSLPPVQQVSKDGFAEQSKLLELCDAWHAAMGVIMSQQYPGEDSDCKTYFGARVLMINYFTTKSVIQNVFEKSESSWDRYRPQYERAVDLCDALLRDQRFTTSNFNLSVGIVLPLFNIAIKCREPVLRRRTIALLARSQRREGVWDSAMSAMIATWLMSVEEETMVNQVVPDEARIQSLKISDDLFHRKASVEGLQRKKGTSVEWVVRRANLAW